MKTGGSVGSSGSVKMFAGAEASLSINDGILSSYLMVERNFVSCEVDNKQDDPEISTSGGKFTRHLP